MSDEETSLQPLGVAPPPPWPGAPVPPTWPPEPPPHRKPNPALLLALVIAMLAAGVAGYAITTEARTSSDNVSTSPRITLPATGGGTTPSGPAQPADPDENVLTRLVLQRSDVGVAYDVQTIPNGNRVTGTTTLDLCNGTYASESLRTARLQVAELDEASLFVMSTEAVLYGHPANTVQAFSELQGVKKACPNRAVTSPVGEDTATTHFNAAPDGAWPQTASVQRLAFDLTTTPEQGAPNRTIAVYLRRGRALLGVYFSSNDATQPAVAGRTTIPAIVQLLAGRLAALPASVVNRG